MNRFWDSILLRVVEAARPRCLVEVGVDSGLLTEKLLAYGAESGAVVHAIDPHPHIDIAAWRERHGGQLVFHRALSLEVLGELDEADLVFIDGDHNWFTVYNELKLLEDTKAKHGSIPPLIALHDVDWPYGRRDMYYDPDTIPEADRHPYREVGIAVSGSDVAGRFNAGFNNAIDEGGPRNGIRTAVEDFMKESRFDWSLTFIPGFHGLAVVIPNERLEGNDDLQSVIGSLQSAQFLDGWARELEQARIRSEVRGELRLSDERHHHAGELRSLHDRLEEVDRLTRLLVDAETRLAAVPDLELRIAELERELADASRATDAAQDQIRALDDRLTRGQRVLTDVFNSPSWRVTKPLRQAKQILDRN
jgi:Methyltransferase domain